MSDVKQSITDLVAKISSDFAIAKDGAVTVKDGVFIRNLPEGVTEEQAVQLQQYNQNFIAAAAHTVGEAAIPVMKKNKELMDINVNIPTIGKDSIDIGFNRERMVHVPNAKEGAPSSQPKYGSLTISVNQYGTEIKKGDLKKIKIALAEKAQAAFANSK